MYFVYILFNENKSYYIGYTEDINKRVISHNTNNNKSTKGHNWRLVYYEAFFTKYLALKREKQLKINGRMRDLLINKLKANLE